MAECNVMKDGLLPTEERTRRIAEVRRKGVFFHTHSAGTAPLSEEKSNKLINDNMDALIGNKKVMTAAESVKYLKGRFAK